MSMEHASTSLILHEKLCTSSWRQKPKMQSRLKALDLSRVNVMQYCVYDFLRLIILQRADKNIFDL